MKTQVQVLDRERFLFTEQRQFVMTVRVNQDALVLDYCWLTVCVVETIIEFEVHSSHAGLEGLVVHYLAGTQLNLHPAWCWLTLYFYLKK